MRGTIATLTIAGIKLTWSTLLFCVAFGLLLFAIWFTDTPFECYLKNMILAKNSWMDKVLEYGRKNKLVGRRLMELIVKNKNEIISDKWSKFRNLEESHNELMSLLYSVNIQTEYTRSDVSTWGMTAVKSELKSITISIPYQYLRLQSNLDLKIVQYIGYNRDAPSCVIPIGKDNIMSEWGETSFRYDDKAQLLHVTIKDNILPSLYWGVVSHDYGRCYLCVRVVSEVEYSDESRASSSKVAMPYGDKYMINKIMIEDFQGDSITSDGSPMAPFATAINQSSYKTYTDYLMRDTKLTMSLSELDEAKRLKKPE